jgi:DNA repair exonuclease SbcCD ATPase subunit
VRLRRLVVRHFRKLQGPVALDPIGDGLTIVSGDNEEGKSTLLAALKCALFEHHAVGGAVREAMAPQGTSLVPEVEVDFVVGGQLWQLRKAFRRGGAELGSGTQRLSGDAAEDRLVELLRFQRRQGRAETRAEHHGLAALFWVDQGTSFGGFASLAVGRERIAAAVASELGALTGGAEAARLAATVRERCDRYWTGTFKAKGPLKETAERHDTLAAEVSVLRTRVAELAGKEERLAQLRDARRRAIETEALAQARARRDEARQRLEGIDALERQAALATERLKAGRAGLAQVEGAAEQRRRSRAALAADELGLRQAARDLDERRLAAAATAAGRDEAELADRGARAAVTAAEAELDRCQRVRQAAERARDLQRLEASLATARDAAEIADRLRARLASDPATQERLSAVREAQRAHDRAAAALAAAATTLELRPAAGRTAVRAGVVLAPAASLELTDRTSLELVGWGEVVVTPGGADIAARRSTLGAAADRLAETLRALGAASLVEAEQRADARTALERDADAARTRLAAAIEAAGYASIDELATQVAILRGPDSSNQSVEADPTVAAAMMAAATEQLTIRRREAEAMLVALRHAETQSVEARQRLALVDQESRRLEGVVAAARLQLAAAEAERSDDALIDAVAAARDACLALEGEADRLARELRLADSETVKARLTMAEREIGQLEAERAQRERTIVELESELRAVGEDGLGERLGEQEGRLSLVAAELGRVRREAMAWKMLHEALDRAMRADRQALLAPVVARLAPWLSRLFPDAAPVMDPHSLAPTGLARGSVEESFDSLSLGTREQIAILVRLGVASLLAEREGESPCLILDDALVYADQARFEIMKTILQRAACELQILVLTCRQRDYFGLDACYLRLDDCRPQQLTT